MGARNRSLKVVASDLRLERLRKLYGSVPAVNDVSLEVRHGEFVSLVGPSGCGKTTVLRIIAGLIDPDAGRVILGGDDITVRAVHRRDLGLVFQSYALFPHMTVFENIAFGLRRRGVSGTDLEARVGRALELVQLSALAGRLPRQISGGQQQRVALARAIVTEPRALLLDEPLSNLDAQLRETMRVELKRLQNQLGLTTVFVTHDQWEALTLSDRLVVMNQGCVEQVGTPEEVYQRPKTPFVAGFIGRSNFLAGEIVAREGPGARVRVGDGLEIAVADGGMLPVSARVSVVIRHEVIRIARSPLNANALAGAVVYEAFAGATSQYVVRLDAGPEVQVEAPREAERLARGTRVFVEWNPEDTLVMAEN